MERMTIRDSDGSVSQPTDLKWEDALERLAAYEDTGLEPEEIVQQSERLKLIDFNQRIKSDRLAEIAKAEYEGRLIVLPCKVGQEGYRLSPGYCDYRDKDMCNAYCDGWDYTCQDYEAELELVSSRFVVSDYPNFGKIVFLTREEAEAALREGADG